jgi:uncharacterized protein DUF4410
MRDITGLRMHQKRVWKTASVMSLILWLSACGSVEVTSSAQQSAVAADVTPDTVYVADFHLQGSDIRFEGPGSNVDRRELLGHVFPDSPLMVHTTRQDKANHLATLMSRSVADDLKKHGLHVERLVPGAPKPSMGWLVSGEFESVDEGDRAKRALIGFGAGHTSLEVKAYVTNLAAPATSQPMLDITTTARSGKAPGAALGFNAFLAAGGFVVAGADSDSDVKHTAAKLSDEIVERLLPGHQNIH